MQCQLVITLIYNYVKKWYNAAMEEIFYHGSKKGGLTLLKPSLSSHQKELVYLTTSEVVACIYTVNAVESLFETKGLSYPLPFSPWYSYGFDKDKMPVLEEYYPDATKLTYKGKKGYIYTCERPAELDNITNIFCARTTQSPVKVLSCRVIEDVYEELKVYEKKGELILRSYSEVSEKTKNYIEGTIKKEIEEKDLKNNGSFDLAVFYRQFFPHLMR